MAVNLTITLETGQLGASPDNNGDIYEDIKVVGSASVAADTGTYTTQFVKRPTRVLGGGFGYSFSGQVLTLTDKAGLGNGTASLRVIGGV